jgi:hypothetical protein
MPADMDYIYAMQLWEEMKELVDQLPHMEREDIANDIESFVDGMRKKHGEFIETKKLFVN